MSLREHERRILAEIERRLDAEAPDLAEQLDSFTAEEDPDAPADQHLRSWRPWLVCLLIAAVTAGLLILLFLLTPGTPQPEPAQSSAAGTGQGPASADLGASAQATGV